MKIVANTLTILTLISIAACFDAIMNNVMLTNTSKVLEVLVMFGRPALGYIIMFGCFKPVRKIIFGDIFDND